MMLIVFLLTAPAKSTPAAKQPCRLVQGAAILSVFPPDHLVHHTHIGLDDADDLGGDVLVHIVGDGDAGEAVADEGDGDIDALEEADGVDAAEDEAAFVQGFGALGRCADAHGREGMTNAGEEGGLLREGAGVGNHRESIPHNSFKIVSSENLNGITVRMKLKTHNTGSS